MSAEIRGAVQLPARREEVSLRTSDGLTLAGELAEPLEHGPVATLVTLHPLPTQGGFMDSHILRKAAARLPALADIAVLRFNTRGTVSPRGRSEGTFGDGEAEAADLAAAVSFVAERGLPVPWLVGWSFGTEVALKHGRGHDIAGLILLSPPLRRTTERELAAWAGDERPMVAVVPEWDDFLPPVQARERFAAVPHARIVDVPEGKHLWVGETQTRRVLDEIVSIVRPGADPLPTEWSGELG
ncbi:MAG: alpha/beta hydrolase [Microbacterium sp.]|uniref:Alpha/beta hydrolase n=1 Tax=Microbacterium ginsengisoli TaxID=400772 RepID=A0A0F0LRH3_9MICO|nr:alpha/beta fold hydrolase [Microbacterium ginsengisoli]KJL35294.1 Alpha/beta hydrolase family protein [Microbacterium ginsengisoli]MAL05857.1 alpha/beta hydrolase [Microbacterium sp.]MBN9208691.1 alpha/beta fold hydrolase [Microbacterium ginsengisoli]HAN26117.1 alpha/beta hydrolase [Microbacterium ginsengisoli]